MQLVYGNYKFPFNSVEIDDNQEKLINKGNQVYGYGRTLTVKGVIYGANLNGSQLALNLASNALFTALSIQGQDLILLQDDNVTTVTQLLNKTSITGVRITKGPRFPPQSPDYVNFRRFEFTAYAEYLYSGTKDLLYDFKEKLSFFGGYPIYGFRDNLLGDPQKQEIYPATAYECTQSGVITGLQHLPTVAQIPPPMFPNDLIEAPLIEEDSPERKGNGYLVFPLTYRYHFKRSGKKFVGAPNLWIK